jgi:hypothetical protein
VSGVHTLLDSKQSFEVREDILLFCIHTGAKLRHGSLVIEKVESRSNRRAATSLDDKNVTNSAQIREKCDTRIALVGLGAALA